MIYFCADDYGLCDSVSEHIQQCIDKGALNKVSIFPNFEPVDLRSVCAGKAVRASLHLNLVEGKCMAAADEVDLLADRNGNLKHTFGGLFQLNLFRRKQLEAQAYREIKAQILHWKRILPESFAFCIDSHQHTHMIPAVFNALLRALEDTQVKVAYMRIPAEPLLPYIMTPSLYLTYSPVNLMKQWLLKWLWLLNKKQAERYNIPSAYFFGILFSGKMDEKRVSKILPKYVTLAKKHGRDIEVLFHPGYTDKNALDITEKNIVFEAFYIAENRKTEFDSVLKTAERSVQ